MRRKVVFPREVLLVEVERRCRLEGCGARVMVSLTKAEAREYTGFECERCERWNEDALTERDIPEWWEELKVASLEGLRPPRGADAPDDTSEVVARMSDAWKELGDADEPADEEGEDGGRF